MAQAAFSKDSSGTGMPGETRALQEHSEKTQRHKLRKEPVSERDPTAMQRDKEAKPKGPGQHQDTEPKARSWQVGQWKGSPEDGETTWQE